MKRRTANLICVMLWIAAGGCSDPRPRTAADILSDLEKERAAGRPEAALKFARDLVNTYGGRPEADTAAKQIPKLEAALKIAEEANKWTYLVNEDAMTSRKAKYATIKSENTVTFNFPYQGSQRGTLMLRDHPTYRRDVIFSIERGQLLC